MEEFEELVCLLDHLLVPLQVLLGVCGVSRGGTAGPSSQDVGSDSPAIAGRPQRLPAALKGGWAREQVAPKGLLLKDDASD